MLLSNALFKFLSREGVKRAEILRGLTAQFAEETLSRTQICNWHNKISDSQESVQNETHTRRHRRNTSETSILTIREMIEENRSLIM